MTAPPRKELKHTMNKQGVCLFCFRHATQCGGGLWSYDSELLYNGKPTPYGGICFECVCAAGTAFGDQELKPLAAPAPE